MGFKAISEDGGVEGGTQSNNCRLVQEDAAPPLTETGEVQRAKRQFPGGGAAIMQSGSLAGEHSANFWISDGVSLCPSL